MDAEERELWRTFAAAEPPEKETLRQKLMERYLPLVMSIANNIRGKLPQHVELEDLFQDGILGLDNAMGRYNLERGTAFNIFSYTRIAGAIWDGIRGRDDVPRLARARSKKFRLVRSQLLHKLGRMPERAEIAAHLNVDEATVEKMEHAAAVQSPLSLSFKRFQGDSGRSVEDVTLKEDRSSPDPAQLAQKHDEIRAMMRGLLPAERMIIHCYYFEEMTMKEIGAAVGLSVSRISQMHSELLLRLKARLTPLRKEDAMGRAGDADLERMEEMRSEEPDLPVGEKSCHDGVPVRTLEQIEQEQVDKFQNLQSQAPQELAKEHDMKRQSQEWIFECLEKPGETFTMSQVVALCDVKESSVKQALYQKGGRCGGFTWKRVNRASSGADEPPMEFKPPTRKPRKAAAAEPVEVAASSAPTDLGLSPKHIATLMYQLQLGSDQMCTAGDMEFLIGWAQKVRSANSQLADILAGKLQVKVQDGQVMTEAN